MSTKEIGSEFWDIPICEEKNHLFPEGTKWFLAGRTALKYIVQDAEITTVSMPCWCCESMVVPFKEAGISVSFYKERPDTNSDAIFVLDYFGYTGHSSVPKGYRGIVIRDMTHSIFSATYSDADYYFGSLRKWAGFWTGGFAWGNWKKNTPIAPYDDRYVSLRKAAMEKKKAYIEGLSSSKSYLAIYEEANRYLEKVGICGAHPADIEAAEHFDWQLVKKIRRENAKTLLSKVDGMFPLEENDCPLFVPVLVENRDKLRQYLIDNKIYCPVHWPRWDLKGQELSLVCDQRYDTDDMHNTLQVLHAFKKTE